jgi:hypothetical protein
MAKRKPKSKVARTVYDCKGKKGAGRKGCKVRRPAADRLGSFPGFDYTTPGGCSKTRQSCPVQLIFKKGVPMLRFCMKSGKNRVVPFKTAAEARKLARTACQCWTRSSKNPTKRSFERCRSVKKLRTDRSKPR